MLPESEIRENLSKPSFTKSLSLGRNWKSKCMRIIPEEFVRSTGEAFQHKFVSCPVIKKYGLEFAPRNSSMYFLLPDGKKLDGYTKNYGGLHGFLGWADVCQRYNRKQGDTVVCEPELSGGVVAAVRVHLVNE